MSKFKNIYTNEFIISFSDKVKSAYNKFDKADFYLVF